jgi:cell division protein FtsW
MGILMLLGLITMYAIGPQRANVLNNAYGTDYYEPMYFFIKQTWSLTLAVVAFFITAVLLSYSFLHRYSKNILIAGFAACGFLFIFGNVLQVEAIAQCSLGACRWFNLGQFNIQPAELLKFGILLYVAGFLGLRAKQGLINDFNKTLKPLGIISLAALLFIVVAQKDMGTGISLIVMLAAMLFVAGLRARIGLILILITLAASVIFIISAPHRIARVATYFSGDNTSVDDPGSYHIAHAKIAIGSGGLLGVGIGNSVQATGYLPEAVNDSIFAILGETFGFAGLMVILGLFTVLLLRVLRVSDGLQDSGQKILVAGIFGWLASHVVLNVGAMIGIIPLTGITLPLLSSGGTSMIVMAAALGLAFQLSRFTDSEKYSRQQNTYTNTRRYQNRRSQQSGRFDRGRGEERIS